MDGRRKGGDLDRELDRDREEEAALKRRIDQEEEQLRPPPAKIDHSRDGGVI